MNTIHNFFSHHNLLAVPGSLIAGIITFLVMSLFLIPFRITVPQALIVAILVFGLTTYYRSPKERALQFQHIEANSSNQFSDTGYNNSIDVSNNISLADVFFVVTYVALLIIVILFPDSKLQLFIPWNEFALVDLIPLSAAVALCFFFPGYAVISVVDKAHKLRPILRGLLAYLLSMFISGFTGYVLASLGFPVSHAGPLLIVIYALALVPFVAVFISQLVIKGNKINDRPICRTLKKQAFVFFRKINQHSSILLIFGSLLTQIILSTYFLYGGIIIGDQWFHHGRSLTLFYGSYINFAASGTDEVYPPFLASLLAVFFTLSSNVPSVNAYASIGFLNIVPVLAFYYFFTSWISSLRVRKAAIMATVLFTLSAGFGWIYALDVALHEPLTSPLSALQTLYTASKQTFDIRSPSTFVLVSHPEVTTGVQLIVLPIGFVILGLIKEATKNRQIKFCVLVFVITTLAILSHDEIYLFIIIASILPLAYRLPGNGYLYAGFICSILVTMLLDALLPGVYSDNKFFGVPLQVLCIIFTLIMWLLYSSMNLFRRIPFSKSTSLSRVSASRLIFVAGMALVVATAFLYTFSYLVWASLSFKVIQLQVSTNNVPWYLYPLKMGLMGILGLAFVVSYVFRKFEKEVFVFGIISLIALLLGPYYDEHRFSKYVMVGLVGFASLLIYELILYIKRTHFKSLFTGILIGCIVVISSFSTLMYIGFQASAIDTNNLDLLWEGRRNFPSLEELHMLQFLQPESTNDTEKSNVITFASEYQTKFGLLGKLQGFSGIPIPLLLKEPGPLILNASTLEALYSDLASTGSGYILLPKKDILGDRGEGEKLFDAPKFVNDHFQKAYEDNNFVILYVPPGLALPSSSGDIALLYDRGGFLSSSLASERTVVLPFNNTLSFENLNNSESVKLAENKNNLILYGDKKSNTLWTNPLQTQNKTQAINYIEGSFRFIGENETKIHSDCGITWDSGKKRFYTYLRDDKLGFTETPSPKDQFVPENKELKWQKWIWYTLKISLGKDSAKIYVDDSLKLQIPGNLIEYDPISRVGIRCSGGIAEFQPMRVGVNSKISNDSLQETYESFHHFYPLSALALSNLTYETFFDSDSSAYSKKNVILTQDPSNQKDIDKYLEVVRRGGTLIVMKTNDIAFDGGFSKFLSISQGNSTQFDSIAPVDHKTKAAPITISGFAREIDFKSMPNNLSIISYYMRNHQPIVPFAIEKKYDSGGRIIFANIAAYFDALFKSPKKYFSTLGNIADLINVNTDNSYHKTGSQDMVSRARFTGNLTASGHTEINSSSLMFLDNTNDTYAEGMYILKRNQNNQPVEETFHKKTPLKNIKLYGQYKAIINSDGVTHLPSPYSPLSIFDYVAVSIPTGSNITFEVSNGSRLEFGTGNQTKQYLFSNNGSTIGFQNIKTDIPEVDSIPVLVKKPEFTVVGNVSFEALYRGNDFYLTKDVFGLPVKLSNVKLRAAVDKVDNYEIAGKNGVKVNYLTYLKSLDIDENRSDELNVKIPGDISDRAKAEGSEVPWKKIIISYPSLITLSVLSIVVFLTWLVWRKFTTMLKVK